MEINCVAYWTKLWDEEGFFIMGVSGITSLCFLNKVIIFVGMVV